MKTSLTLGLLLAATMTLLQPVQAQSAKDWIDLTKQDGAGIFAEKCGMCHKANGMGTGILARRLPAEQALLENRKDLTAPLIETVVRSGFGVMYPISRGEVSDEQLNKIKQYLVK
jgi:mono/diheme cytochrome c family protein